MLHDHESGEQRGWKGWLWMVACCVPMVAIIVLALLGYWGAR